MELSYYDEMEPWSEEDTLVLADRIANAQATDRIGPPPEGVEMKIFAIEPKSSFRFCPPKYMREAIEALNRLGTAARDAQAQIYTYAITRQMAIIKAKRIAANRRLISRQRTRRNK